MPTIESPLHALERLRESYQSRESEARQRKQRGETVVGYLSANVPEELIIAGGMFPVQLSGDPALEPSVGDEYMEYFHDGHIRSLFDRALRGHFAFVDLLIIPRTSEGYLQLFYYLLDLKRLEPHRPIPEVYLFDLLQTAFWRTGRYNRDRLDDLTARLEKLAGKEITSDKILGAICLLNENRRLLSKVQALRRAVPARLRGSDALVAIGTASFLDRGVHSGLLRTIVDGVEQLPTLDGPRIMIKGSVIDTLALYEQVERAGGVVVASDHPWGEGTFEHETSASGDPLEALTDHYHLHSASVRQYPQSTQDKRFLDLLDAGQVQGVVFYLDEWDDTLGWDYPAQKKLLDDKGVPSVLLKQQSYFQPSITEQSARIQELLASIASATVATLESA